MKKMHSGLLLRSIFFSLAVAMCGLSACSQSPDCFRGEVFCAGLVTNTAGIEDHGLNQNAWLGMQRAHRDGIADYIAFIESVDGRDYAKNIAVFVEEGYDVIVTIGPGMDDETLRAAERYPDSVFIGIDQPQKETRPNLLSITFREDQMGFWAGVLAARLTKTGVVAGVCETSGIASTWRYCEGFRLGAAYADEEVKSLIKYRDHGSSEKLFVDSDWGYESARELIERGADVVFAAGGGTGQGALLAAADADLLAIGAERDQAAALTEAGAALVTSVYARADLEVQKWMRSIREGTFVGGEAVGVFAYVPYREVRIRISDSTKEEMDELMASLFTGALETGVSPSAP